MTINEKLTWFKMERIGIDILMIKYPNETEVFIGKENIPNDPKFNKFIVFGEPKMGIKKLEIDGEIVSLNWVKITSIPDVDFPNK